VDACRLAEQEAGAQADVDHLVPLGFGDLEDGAVLLPARRGAVHEDGDLSEVLDRGLEQGLGRTLLAEVRDEEAGVKLACELAQRAFGHVAEEHASAVGDERPGYAPADPGRSARDQGGIPFQQSHLGQSSFKLGRCGR
jgi:hypothetical protein